MPLEVTRNIGYLPENNPLYDYMYVREYLLYMAQMSGLEKQQRLTRVEELVDMVGLGKMANKRIKELSKGYKQRVGFAQALLGVPEILILDDSSSALDYKTDASMRKAISQHHADSTTIMIAQRVSSIMNMTKILVMDNGRVIGYGTHEELLESCPDYRSIYEIQIETKVEKEVKANAAKR